MKYDHSTLPDNAAELKKIILGLQKQSTKTEVDYQAEINYLNEQIRILQQTIFGAKSEKSHIGKIREKLLFQSIAGKRRVVRSFLKICQG